MKIRKNGLTLNANADGSFSCDDLKELPKIFSERYENSGEARQASAEYIQLFRSMATAGGYASKEEQDAVPESERRTIGLERFDKVVEALKLQTKNLSEFESFLFWFGLWWYYHPEITLGVRFTNRDQYQGVQEQLLSKLLLPILPAPIQAAVREMELASVANGHGHFALLFINKDKRIRRIVTDTQLFELHEVAGYAYLDITEEGKPIARSTCERGGGRVFFDGVRLMSHGKFETCAPSTVIIQGGYKVNSTKCTIVNGQLFDLIDVDDKVARTTGAFMGCVEYTRRDAAEALILAKQSGEEMAVSSDSVSFRGRTLKPLGIFSPAPVSLLENGFALYGWSDFHELEGVRYERVLVVDDKAEWIAQVEAEFGKEVTELSSFETTSGEAALERILATNPDAVVLDVHFTPDERFEGLWIANQLAAKNFSGAVWLASSYEPEALRAMQRLIRMRTVATGKDLKKIRRALYGKVEQ